MGYDQVYRDLRNLGYRVETGIYTASEVGAPHQRERIFILAILENANVYGFGRINQGGFHPEIVGTNSTLGDTESFDKRNERNEPRRPERQNRRPGFELANSDHIQRGLPESEKWNEGPEVERICNQVANSTYGRCQQCKQTTRFVCKSNEGCGEMADTRNDGQNGTKNHKSDDQGKRRDPAGADELFKSNRFGNNGNDDRFPAGQGAFQYEWEEPRTIESSMVYTIDGYNFTEDLHRAIGNSVVEQTAELAFRDLWNKHFPDNKI